MKKDFERWSMDVYSCSNMHSTALQGVGTVDPGTGDPWASLSQHPIAYITVNFHT